MNEETPAQLVAHLSHPNGWWRDTAQQLLVLKQDTSVVPALQAIVKTSPNLLARFHALWTLEGLGALDAPLARQMMENREPRMRIQAIRASETLYKAGDRSFAADYERMTKDADADVAIQAMLTMNRWKVPNASEAIKAASSGRPGARRAARRQRDPESAGQRPGRRRGRTRADGGAAAGVRPRRADLQRSLLRVPRSRRPRDAEARAQARRWRRRSPGRRASAAIATTS